MSNSFSVSLQVWHPDADPKSIVAGIGLPPKRCWQADDQRATVKGKILDGEYRQSYCLFELEDSAGRELYEFLGDVLGKLEARAPFIWQLRQTGGKVSFYVLWEPGDHRGESFEVELLADMARIGIDLGIQPLF